MKNAPLKIVLIAICASIPTFVLAQATGPGQEKTVTVPKVEAAPTAGQSNPTKHDGTALGTVQHGQSAMEVDTKGTAQTDATFLQEVDMAAMAMMAHSQLASSRASNPQVKALAQTLIADHAAMTPKLDRLAAAKKADDVKELDQARQLVVSRLEKLDGTKFDRAYVEQIVHETDNTIAFYEIRSKATQDDDVSAFISESLPVVHRQRDRATAIFEKAEASK